MWMSAEFSGSADEGPPWWTRSPRYVPAELMPAEAAAFLADIDEQTADMESLQEHIQDMEKARQRTWKKGLREDLSQRLRMARKRLRRLKKNAHFPAGGPPCKRSTRTGF